MTVRSLAVRVIVIAVIVFLATPVQAQTVCWGLGAIDAQKVHRSGYTGQSVKVAIVGTGIDLSHPDIQVAGGHSFDASYTESGSSWQGTFAAGIVAALDNQLDTLGVSPNVELYAIRVMPDWTGGDDAAIAAGIHWCINNGMDIVLLNLEFLYYREVVATACQAAADAGLLLIAGSGEHGQSSGLGDRITYPARLPSVMAVGAVNSANMRARWSGTGPALEVVAPGVSVLSLKRGGGTWTKSGTFVAAAHVAGIAALLKSMRPEWSMNYIRERIRHNALPLGGSANEYGSGLAHAVRSAPRVQLGLEFDGLYYEPYDWVTFTAHVWFPGGKSVAGANVTVKVYWNGILVTETWGTTGMDGKVNLGFGVVMTGAHSIVAEARLPGYVLGDAFHSIYVYDDDVIVPEV